jgi:hypothetical protein
MLVNAHKCGDDLFFDGDHGSAGHIIGPHVRNMVNVSLFVCMYVWCTYVDMCVHTCHRVGVVDLHVLLYDSCVCDLRLYKQIYMYMHRYVCTCMS